MENYDREPLENVFFLFPNKTRIGKRNRELLEMLFRTFASSATNIFKLRLVTKWEEI